MMWRPGRSVAFPDALSESRGTAWAWIDETTAWALALAPVSFASAPSAAARLSDICRWTGSRSPRETAIERMKFDHSTDVLVVGSGGGALAAALVARILGGQVLVVEKTALYGGTSATSGGNIWVPNCHRTNASAYPDSRERALAYLTAAIGDLVPCAMPSGIHPPVSWARSTQAPAPPSGRA
jgi:hypothetical protein